MENLISQLHTHACEGNVDKLKECIKKCLEEGISLDEVDEHGWTALIKAALNEQIEAMEVLIKAGADVNATKGDKNIIRVVRGVSVSEKLTLKIILLLIENGAGWNAYVLHYAAQYGHLELIKNCIAAGVSVDAVDSGRDTPLMTAAVFGQTEAMEVLIAKGANVNGIPGGQSILGRVVKFFQSDEIRAKVIKVLLRYGVDLASEPLALDLLSSELYERLMRYQTCLQEAREWSRHFVTYCVANYQKIPVDANKELRAEGASEIQTFLREKLQAYQYAVNVFHNWRYLPLEVIYPIMEYTIYEDFKDFICEYATSENVAKEATTIFFDFINQKPYTEEQENIVQEEARPLGGLASRP